MTTYHRLECTPEGDSFKCVTTKYGPDGKLIDTIKHADIPLSNKIITNSKTSIECVNYPGGETYCDVNREPEVPQTLPNICVNTHGVPECGIKSNRPFLIHDITNALMGAEKKKPGFNEFLIDNNVFVVLDKTLNETTKGYADCRGGKYTKIIGFDGSKDMDSNVGILLHEFAHCREDIARSEKGLPPLKQNKTGGWKHYADKTVPYGHEIRAEKFRKRIMK